MEDLMNDDRLPAAQLGHAEEVLASAWKVLLRSESVGRHDNFFELGGNSLLLLQLLAQLRQAGFVVDVGRAFQSRTLAELATYLSPETGLQFKAPANRIPIGCERITPEMLPLLSLEASHIERIVELVPGGSTNIQDIYPLAPSQEGILFHHRLNDGVAGTNILTWAFSVCSHERLDALIAALKAVIARHDVLRSVVLWEMVPQPLQVVLREIELPIKRDGLFPDRSLSEQIGAWMSLERQRFEISQAPLLQLCVASNPQSTEYYVLLKLHRLIADNNTAETVIAEMIAHLKGNAANLAVSIPYRDHVAGTVARAGMRGTEEFFRAKVSDIVESTAPFELLDVRGDGSRIDEASEELELILARRVRTQARRLRISTATLFYAAWGLVVSRTSGRTDIVYGTAISGRFQEAADAQQALGMFMNMLPVRLRLDNVTALELIELTQRELIDLISHGEFSLAAVQRCSGIIGSAPLFTALFNYWHILTDRVARYDAPIGIETLEFRERTSYPILVSVVDSEKQFFLNAQTDRCIDPSRVLGYLTSAMSSLVDALERAPTMRALALSILPDRERHEVLKSFNATRQAYPEDKLVHELFEEQVQRTPQAVALICEGKTLTYLDLNGEANRLAHYLHEAGLRADERVGLCVERSFSMLTGMLGILKAGGAYLPLDPQLPVERLRYMLEDSAPRLVLSQEHLRSVLPMTSIPVTTLESISQNVGKYDDSNFDPLMLGLISKNLAYILYTSGTTGRPKGVMIEHGSLINFIYVQTQKFSLSNEDRVLQLSSFGYDGVVEEVFPSLAVGASIILRPNETVAPDESFVTLLQAERVTVADLPTAFWHQWVLQIDANFLTYLPRLLVVGGEKAERQDLDEWRKRISGRASRWLYTYGPTETTVIVTAYAVDQFTELSEGEIPIGCPISNTQIYILDESLVPVPVGVGGEIYIGGVAVGRGYLSQPRLTSERFLADPYELTPDARMYKTGDLGRWRADGNIEYLGRNDDQVKLRGFRIEPGEIETQLRQHPKVKQAAAVVRIDQRGDKRLVAYVVPQCLADSDVTVNAEELRAHLLAVLPAHMVPSAFVLLERLPLTHSGKLDRKGLPAPELEAYVTRRYEKPQGEVEETVAKIWEELLQFERIGRWDNFFELGGHSLLTADVIARVSRAFRVNIPLRGIFENSTVAGLSGYVIRVISAKDSITMS